MVFETMADKKARIKGDMPFAQKCTQAGIRMTSQRHLLATVLGEAVDHPDVETIYLRCKKKTALYRLLQFTGLWVFLKNINSSKNSMLVMASAV